MNDHHDAMAVVAARTDGWSPAQLAAALTVRRPWLMGKTFAEVAATDGAEELARKIDPFDRYAADREWRNECNRPSGSTR